MCGRQHGGLSEASLKAGGRAYSFNYLRCKLLLRAFAYKHRLFTQRTFHRSNALCATVACPGPAHTRRQSPTRTCVPKQTGRCPDRCTHGNLPSDRKQGGTLPHVISMSAPRREPGSRGTSVPQAGAAELCTGVALFIDVC